MTDTERAVYMAVGRLVLKGEPAADLTVAAIAKEAGVGKGTVYGYVRSKEELIARGMVLTLSTAAEAVLGSVRKAGTFREKAGIVLEEIAVLNACRSFLAEAFRASEGLLLSESTKCAAAEAVFPTVEAIVADVAEAARKERLLCPEADANEVRYLIASAFGGYGFLQHLPELCGGTDADGRKELTLAGLEAAFRTLHAPSNIIAGANGV